MHRYLMVIATMGKNQWSGERYVTGINVILSPTPVMSKAVLKKFGPNERPRCLLTVDLRDKLDKDTIHALESILEATDDPSSTGGVRQKALLSLLTVTLHAGMSIAKNDERLAKNHG